MFWYSQYNHALNLECFDYNDLYVRQSSNFNRLKCEQNADQYVDVFLTCYPLIARFGRMHACHWCLFTFYVF